jgi:hypothetical protein
MPARPSIAVRLVWAACLCLLLAPRLAAAAEPLLLADFDGDGQRDRVTLSRREPSVLRLWLSASRQTLTVKTEEPVQHVVAADLDGDHRPELIARSGKSRLHVWSRATYRFKSVRPPPISPGALATPHPGAADDDDSEGPKATVAVASPAMAWSSLARAPALVCAPSPALYTDPAISTVASIDPFFPRPPPPSTASL